MSQDLQQARYDKLVRRVGSLYGGGSKVTEVLQELFPVLDMENVPSELLVLNGWDIATASTERPANVATIAASQLFNPAGSGRIASITQLSFETDNGTIVSIGTTGTVHTGAGVAGKFRDTRNGVLRRTALETRTVDGTAANADLRFHVVAAEKFTLKDQNGLFVLSPGAGLGFSTSSLNTRLTVNYFWRERVAEPSELLFP